MLKFAVLQADLAWEEKQRNLHLFDKMMDRLDAGTELVILPETFSTGFTMRSDLFADGDGETLTWMKQHAREGGFVVTGSVIVREDDRIFNRMFWVTPDGGVSHYDKRHLFRMGRENEHFSNGDRRVIVEWKGFRFILQICYDLRFPVFVRNRADYDVILNVANWPAPRHAVYEVLLKARAIENQAFVIAANRAGTDGEGVGHKGASCLIDPKGRIVAQLDDRPGILTATMNLSDLRSFRESFPVHRDADRFSLDIS